MRTFSCSEHCKRHHGFLPFGIIRANELASVTQSCESLGDMHAPGQRRGDTQQTPALPLAFPHFSPILFPTRSIRVSSSLVLSPSLVSAYLRPSRVDLIVPLSTVHGCESFHNIRYVASLPATRDYSPDIALQISSNPPPCLPVLGDRRGTSLLCSSTAQA